jgi:hypothetical protein
MGTLIGMILRSRPASWCSIAGSNRRQTPRLPTRRRAGRVARSGETSGQQPCHSRAESDPSEQAAVSRLPLGGVAQRVFPDFRSNKSTGAGGQRCFNNRETPDLLTGRRVHKGCNDMVPGWTGLARIPLAAASRTAHHGRACSVGASTAWPRSGATEAMNCSALRRLKPVAEHSDTSTKRPGPVTGHAIEGPRRR